MPGEISQTEKVKSHTPSLTCGTQNRMQQRKQTNRLIDTDDGMVVSRGKVGSGAGMKRVKGVKYLVTEDSTVGGDHTNMHLCAIKSYARHL